MLKLPPDPPNLRKWILLTFAVTSVVACICIVVSERHRGDSLVGKWCGSSLPKEATESQNCIELSEGGLIVDGDVSSTWSYFHGEVIMSPQGGPDTIYVLSDDGKRLTGKVVKDFVYKKRP